MPGATRAVRNEPNVARSDEPESRGVKAARAKPAGHETRNARPVSRDASGAKSAAAGTSAKGAAAGKATGRVATPVEGNAGRGNAGRDTGKGNAGKGTARKGLASQGVASKGNVGKGNVGKGNVGKTATKRSGASVATANGPSIIATTATDDAERTALSPKRPARKAPAQASRGQDAQIPQLQAQPVRTKPKRSQPIRTPQVQTRRTQAQQAQDMRPQEPEARQPGPQELRDAHEAKARQVRSRERVSENEPGAPIHVPGERLGSLQAEYLSRLGELVRSQSAPQPADRRFAGEAWRQGPYAWTASLYLLNEEFMKRLAESVEGGSAKTRERIRFATEQWLAAISPANFLLTNPEAQKRVLETQGESLRSGIGNLLNDLQRGRISQTDESAFEVGVNVATSAGSVVFENDLVQLIQYAPSTETVGSRPLLMVPPCINKFYILDLQPENSLVAYAAAQGHTVFMVSWKNVQADQGHLGWDDYIDRGVIEPMRVVREISGEEHINTLGFCVGGTLLVTAAAVLAARGDDWIEAMTLLTSFIDFSRPGSIGVFIDEHQVAYRESTIGSGGIMPGRELALTFNYLRPNDLVWNYVVANYLKGEPPPAFDLLYWNADSTNLPGPMYCWYLRHMYLQNELRQPGRLVCLGVPVDVGEIGVPTYIYASREDHIVPWQGAYESTQLLSGPLRFALGASGHIAGVINPPAKGKRSHWLGEKLPDDAEEWFAQASERPGSWWPDWAAWLADFAGERRPAPKAPGSARYPAIEPAPGRYVKEKAG